MNIRPAVLIAILGLMTASAPTLAAESSDRLRLEWLRLPDLPDPAGLKGMYGGTSAGRMVLAGGSNFPVAARDGGRKMFHAAIFTRPVDAGPDEGWRRDVTVLPRGAGEGASVTALGGVVTLGGHDGTVPLATVGVLRWSVEEQRVTMAALPDLPAAVTNPAAAVQDRWLFVAGGDGGRGGLGTLWRLDLAAVARNPAAGRWETLVGWPGPPRFGAVLVPVQLPQGAALLLAGGIAGRARGQADYLRDAHVYLVAARRWRTIASLPRGAVLAAGLALGDGRVLVLGGSDGHDFERMQELGERYRIPQDALAWDARTDRWQAAGIMPLGLVGAALVRADHGWLVAGGEYSPGLRTAQVHRLTVDRAGATPAEDGKR